jgi:hypothetical protein
MAVMSPRIGDVVRTADPLTACADRIASWSEVHRDVIRNRRAGVMANILSVTFRDRVLRSVVAEHADGTTGVYAPSEVP